MTIPVITIDGPTASGKGTVAAAVAAQLGFHVLDSGALYRLLAYAALERGVPLDDEARLVDVARSLDVQFAGAVVLDGRDVTEALRAERIGNAASRIAGLHDVRAALVDRQLAFRRPPGLVADGRDMGTVIFPDADLKVYLLASVEARAARRYKQLIEKGFSPILPDLLQNLRERDARDINRAESPLKPAEDARIIDTSTLAIHECVAEVLALWADVKSR